MAIAGARQTATVETRPVILFACGDPLRGDDSVAPRAVRGMAADALHGVDVRLIGALEPEYLVGLPVGARVLIVDAVVGPPPGRIVEMELYEMSGRARSVVTLSSHQLPLDRVVALAQLLRDEPVVGRFVGVGIEAVAEGEPLSEPVEAALPSLRQAIARALDDLAAPAGPAAPKPA